MTSQRGVVCTVLAVLLVACGGGGTSSAPTEGTQATGAPATEQEAAEATAAEEEAAPSGSARIGVTAPSVAYVPTLIVAERMQEMGYNVEIVEFEGNSALIQASVDNLVDINSATVAAQMPAIDAGLETDFFLTRYLNEFVLVAKSEFQTCESLDGQRVAIHAQTDITGLLTLEWFEQNCPDAEPSIQIVSGSENRLAGLLQDQLDASPLDLQDTIRLQQERPDEFFVLANFVEEIPVLGGVYSAPPEYLAENEQLVTDFIAEHVAVWQEIADDPEFLIQESERLLPEIDPEALPEIVDQYAELGIFPLEDPLDLEAVDFSAEFFADAGGFANIGTADEIADRSYVEAALSASG